MTEELVMRNNGIPAWEFPQKETTAQRCNVICTTTLKTDLWVAPHCAADSAL